MTINRRLFLYCTNTVHSTIYDPLDSKFKLSMFQTTDINKLTLRNLTTSKLIQHNNESYFNFETTSIKLYFTIKNYLISDNVVGQIISKV